MVRVILLNHLKILARYLLSLSVLLKKLISPISELLSNNSLFGGQL